MGCPLWDGGIMSAAKQDKEWHGCAPVLPDCAAQKRQPESYFSGCLGITAQQ
jgi:hypothetical protein